MIEEAITTQGIRIWSPTQVRTPTNAILKTAELPVLYY